MRAFTKVILWRDEFTVDQAAERNPRSGQRAADAPLSVREADVAATIAPDMSGPAGITIPGPGMLVITGVAPAVDGLLLGIVVQLGVVYCEYGKLQGDKLLTLIVPEDTITVRLNRKRGVEQ